MALDRFEATGHLLCRPIGLVVTQNGKLEVTHWTSWSPEFAPKGGYEKVALALPARFMELKAAWPELGAKIDGFSPRFFVRHDYGGGSITVGCLDTEGKYVTKL